MKKRSTRRVITVSRHRTTMRHRSVLRSSYGEVILRKGTILYHVSKGAFQYSPLKSLLFFTFHPSDVIYRVSSPYITRIELQRDISLLFMISQFHQTRIMPLLDKLTGSPGRSFVKQHVGYHECYTQYLRKDRFDGWLSSFDGKQTVEVAILNIPGLYRVIESAPVIYDWRNSHYVGDTFVQKNWGMEYPLIVSTPLFRLHQRFESQIEKYLLDTDLEEPSGYIFPQILRSSVLEYIDTPFVDVRWDVSDGETTKSDGP
jgi:hypothetical protein